MEQIQLKSEISKIEKNEILKPFIRWAGGKQFLVKDLLKYIPSGYNTYHEPFLGAGSVFFAKESTKSFISDINGPLINGYCFIRDKPQELHRLLSEMKEKTSDTFYYAVRDKFNSCRQDYNLEQAARFIYLIHSSFNGIYRVNKKGEYNVPFGKPKPAIPELQHFFKLSEKLQEASLSIGFYDENEAQITKDDFVYLDPPYPPLSQTAFFRHYTIERFSSEDQISVYEFAQRLSEKGTKVMISNADVESIRELYKGWNFIELDSTRYVSCKSTRVKVKELIIKNY